MHTGTLSVPKEIQCLVLNLVTMGYLKSAVVDNMHGPRAQTNTHIHTHFTFSLHSEHSSVVPRRSTNIDSRAPTAQHRPCRTVTKLCLTADFSFSQSQLKHSFAVKTLSLLHWVEINSSAFSLAYRRTDRQIWRGGTASCDGSARWLRADLSPRKDGWGRLAKQMFGSDGLRRSPSRILVDKRRMRLRNAAHPCNSLLRLSLTSRAVKKMFIEGRGQTLMLSRDCGTPVEVINIKANMTVLSDESQNRVDIILVFIPLHCPHNYTIFRVTFPAPGYSI